MKTAVAVVVVSAMAASGFAQAGKQYTKEDYARAEKFMTYNVAPLVYHGVTGATWMADGRLWYRDTGADGSTIVVVDPAKGSKGAAFDQVKLAKALNATGQKVDAKRLAVSSLELSDGDKTVIVGMGPRRFRCDLSGEGVCSPAKSEGAVRGGGRGARNAEVTSPDKTKAAFIRDWNLWVRDLATAKETQLTTDGVKDYGYATDNAGWTHSDRAILVWSPDSKKIATFQQDQRKTGEMYLVPVVVGHPTLTTLKYPLVGDKDVTMIERVVIDVDAPRVVRLKMPPDQHRSTICDDVSCRGGDGWDDVQWGSDSKQLAFVSTSRDHQQEWFRVADASTGDVHDVMHETAPKFFESGIDKVNWKYLQKSNEILWFSEKEGWGHLYLMDATTGKLKNKITHGDGNVSQVQRVDEASRTIWFLAVGKDAKRDPYFSSLYKVGFDGSGLQLLTPEDGDHSISLSQNGAYFVDTYSKPDVPAVTVVRSAMDGRVLVEVAKTDIAALVAYGWVPPVPFTVKARDGKTDLYGLMFKPTNFDPAKKYPIVNHVYPGPQTGSCGPRAFLPARGDSQSLAELGFIVVCIDGMGTPWRSKAFHETYFADLGDNTIPDQVTGMKQLAARYPWIDLDKAGMYGHSGGGNATAAAMFHYPDFFKVGIAESGNHDNRVYEDDWAEKWAGLLVKNADGTSNYDSQANQRDAKNLKGHLLLAHGTMDDNVPMNNTLLVVDALIKANKDFDLLLIPNVAHGYGAATPYMTRRRWDYFVRYLMEATPPKEYELKPQPAPGGPGGGPESEE